ncbi:hypothetical protein ACTOB_003061 [Actinoplanes oblitus]|uniref:FtsH ternary system domain-containing protein n=1 Tax=Actinoplanes oblitus TaxID=3040509 RepID=A0ABY8WRE0_9ACTN|nr:hypothetical protein [Actinoplanes oblitus]WIM99410.1 hypothetical protein ACTOB_003061 [Actinoplanes oblitus]
MTGISREPRSAGRFGTAAGALAFLGELLALTPRETITVLAHRESRSFWISAPVDLAVCRELVLAAGGQPQVDTGDRFVRDRGFGPPPAHSGPGTGPARAGLTPVPPLTVVRLAGLQPATRHPLRQAVVLMPGAEVASAVRRGLDLELELRHRPVTLRPLFPADDAVPGVTAMIEVRVSAPHGHLPPSYLSGLMRRPLTVVCRSGGADAEVLIQYDLAAPIPDERLAALVEDDAHVLADASFGCWRLTPAGTGFAPSDSLARLRDAPRLVSPPLSGDHTAIEAPEVHVLPTRTAGPQRVDAILLDDQDLEFLPLLLDGHPLAEVATVVPGRDRHLLTAAGGVLDRLPVGAPLVCAGPGLLYLPLGHRMSPRLPPAARTELFEVDDRHAVVVLPDAVLRFDLARRRPSWELWVGEPPEFDLQLPGSVTATLDSLTPKKPARPAPRRAEGAAVLRPLRRGWGRITRDSGAPRRTWRDDALDLEIAGDLARAAEMHRLHGDPLRAANLFERAARQ